MAKEQQQRRAEKPADKPAEQLEQVPTLGLDEGPAQSAEAGDDTPVETGRGRQGDDSKPYCPLHNCLLVATGSKPGHTHYACPVAGCDSREKRARPAIKVPARPQMCPQRSCREAGAALEADPRLSNVAQLNMICPRCGFSMKVPRPHFDAAAAQRARRQDVDDLAAR
jgi:hypothetical protein